MPDTRKMHGFSLIELSIVMVIAGLALSAITMGYATYYSTYRYHKTYSRLNIVKSALNNYTAAAISLPFPSDPDLSIHDPNAGCECGSCTATEAQCNILMKLPVGKCKFGICKVAGARHTIINPDTGHDPVYIGGVPYKTINAVINAPSATGRLTQADARDAWGYQLGYAVSWAATQPSTYEAGAGGVIDVRTEHGLDLTSPHGIVSYVLWSAGNNHMGAHAPNGSVPVPCKRGSADYENCNNNALFTDGLRSLGTGRYYFDDALVYATFQVSPPWSFTALGKKNIYNNNIGNVGVGAFPQGTMPVEKLQVKGMLYAQGAVTASQICDATGQDCWHPEVLAGPSTGSNTCPETTSGDEYVTALRHDEKGNLRVTCGSPAIVTPEAGQACPKGEIAYGFSASSGILCGSNN